MSKSKDKPTDISRREFARQTGIAAASAICLPAEILVRESNPPPQAQQEANTKLSPESQAEVEEKVQAIFRKYGTRLSEDQKGEIRRLVAESQKPLDAIRKFPLQNSDQPANVMKIYPDAKSVQHRQGT